MRSTARRSALTSAAVTVMVALAVVVGACAAPSPSPGGGGTGTTTTTTVPGSTTTLASGVTTTTLVPGGNTPPTLVAGLVHTCSLRPDGTVRCWGNNAFGQLGHGTTVSSTLPGTVARRAALPAIPAGHHDTSARRGPLTDIACGNHPHPLRHP